MVESNKNASLYTLRKDQKPCDDQIKGPKTRPVCSGSSTYNRKLSHLISMLIRPLWQEEETISTNTEEVMAAFSEMNSKNITNEIAVGSADVKALYPSLDAVASSQLAFNAIMKSQVQTKGDNFAILSIYLYLMLGYSGMVENGLGDEVLVRKYYKKSKYH